MKQDFLYSAQFDFRDYNRSHQKKISLLFVPRSGSTLLACLLAQTELLGFPLEYFARPNLSLLYNRLPEFSITHLDPLFKVRTTPNGVFSYKWDHNHERDPELARTRDKIRPDYLIVIDREDKYQQARSFVIAQKTQEWVIPKSENRGKSQTIYIDHTEIENAREILAKNREGLHTIIKTLNKPFLEISYEAILKTPQEIVETIGTFCDEKISTRVSLDQVPIAKQGCHSIDYTRRHFLIKNGSSDEDKQAAKPQSKLSADHTFLRVQEKPLDLLLATNHLFSYTGSEITIFTLAKSLKDKGHSLSVFAKYIDPHFVKIFSKIATVYNDIRKCSERKFDAAYVQHHPIALEVRQRFPGLPILFASLGVLPFLERPPLVDLSIHKYLAISEEVKSSLIQKGVKESIIEIFRNIVDSKKFRPTRCINQQPESAIIYSYKIESSTKEIIMTACHDLSIKCHHIGEKPGAIEQDKLADEINKADIVFTLGRGVIETMMCGRIPVVFDVHGGDGLVTPGNMHEIMTHNFSGRLKRRQYPVSELTEELKRFNSEHALKLRELAIKYFDADQGVERLISLIRSIMTKPTLNSRPTSLETINSLVELINTTKEFSELNFAKFQASSPACSIGLAQSKKPAKERQVSFVSSLQGQIRPIAFYLPQFHPTPENDKWWGKGFTEWTNVSKAKPLFPEHYQPHLPGELGFYDLRLLETRNAQAGLAKDHGIYGFCYYHYWFNGKRLLDRPIHEVVECGEPNFPFCLCWANENWTRTWDGSADKILIAQGYNGGDDLEHIRYLLGIFRDPRYICVDNKPLFLVYRATRLPNPKETLNVWRNEARKFGIDDLYLCRVESFSEEQSDPYDIGFDAAIEFQPDWERLKPHMRDQRYPDFLAYRYEQVVKEMLRKKEPRYKRFPCVCPGWDNTPRRGGKGTIFTDSSPNLYEYWLGETIRSFAPPTPSENFVFINSWNEWGEGSHLEPDRRFGRAYLESTRQTLCGTNTKIVAAENDVRRKPRQQRAAGVRASIIIPVFNKVEYTRKCVQSIFANSTSGSYEIIFVDNGSKDETSDYLKDLDGPVKIIVNSQNLGFVKACNQGARVAHSDYLVFLNNDTEPQPGWLDSLIDVADARPKAGAIGAKLIYPDGRLQEAGGIIFSDGSGYNFGRGDDPARESYNKPCEVDYCSGACLLVRRGIFESLAGFDERYSPAYYEETDLCFSIRKLGYSVLYNPKSTVIHHEFVTSGSPDSGSAKAYLRINQQKFFEKWGSELQGHEDPPCKTGRLPNTASRERLQQYRRLRSSVSATHSAQILVFYPHNPSPPRTGSHRRCISMLRAFRNIGMKIHLVSSTAFSDQPWTLLSQRLLRDELQVESHIYAPNEEDQAFLRHHFSLGHRDGLAQYRLKGLDQFFKDKFRELKPEIVLVNYAYWGYLTKGLPLDSSLNIIEMHDVVTLNDRMQKLVWERIGNPPFKTASLPMDEDFCRRASLNPDPYEFAVYDEYDLVLAISAKEAELTQKSAKKTVVETLPMSFEAVPLNNSYKGSPVFVASANVFNFQGYLYLTGRVLPRFLHLYSDFHMEVIGDGCRYLRPTAGVQLWGFQPDLKPFYAQAPFAVCPLLAGTGQQIKIVEAMAHGVPVIAMKNIAESSPIIHGVNGFIAEDGQSFARWMQFCLENRGVCSELGRKARETIHAEYSEKGLQLKLEIILNRALERKSKSGERCVETEKKRSAAKSRSHQVLWIRTDSIGDNILAAAMLPHVKEKYPRAKITVLCQEHIKELYQPSPWVDSIVTFHRNRAYSDAVYRAELAARLGESHFDLTLNSVYSREALTDFFSIASKAKEIIGINGDLCNINSSERERNNRAYTCLVSSVNEMAPEIDRHREFLAALGINAPALRPVMWLTLDDEAYADRIFMQTGFDPAKTVGFFAGAQSKLRLYPNYGRALSQLCKDRGLQLIALGAASDYQINAAFLREIGGSSLNLSGKTSLRQAAAILKRCRLGVGAETGLAHMACAVAAPHVVLIGGGHFGRFMPYSPLTTVVCLPLDCFGCNWRCRHEVPHCIQGIDPGILVQALSDALDSGASAARIFVQSRVDWQTSAGRPLWQWPPPCKLPTDLQVQVTTCFNTVSREAKSVAADTQSTSKLTAHPLRNKLQKACPI